MRETCSILNEQMAINSDDSDESDDGGFDEDMEALRKACILNNETIRPNNLSDADVTSESEEEDDDDFEVLRNIQKRFDVQEPLNLKPISSLPPLLTDSDDDSDDDLDILRAIQHRFSRYGDDDNLKNSTDQQVSATTTIIDSEKETTFNNFESFSDSHEFSGAENDVVASSTTLPRSAEAFLEAIKKNRLCQKHLRSKLIQIEAKIEENTKLRKRVEALRGIQISCRKTTGRALSQKIDALVQLISVPKTRINATVKKEKNAGPAENSHVSNYRMVLKHFPVSFSRDKWTEAEDENIVKGIKQQFQDMLLQKTYQKQEMLHQKLDDILLSDAEEEFYGDSNDLDSIVASISDFDITHENMRVFVPKVNWEQLASMYVTRRSGAECKARWLNWKDPLINKDRWAKLEETHLLFIVQQKGLSNWIDIAASLGTNRTPFQCLAYYQSNLNGQIKKKEWTEDEDDKLRAAVEEYDKVCAHVGTSDERDWVSIVCALEGRTSKQCSERWRQSLDPERTKIGTWNTDEDKRLKVAAMIFGAKNWRNIAQYVPGRNQMQCNERWTNSLDPKLNMGKWSEEEDSRLKVAVAEYGHLKHGRWRKVAECVPPRTDSQCLRRWKKLQNVALKLQWINSVPETENIDSRKSGSKRGRKKAQTLSEGGLRLTDDGSENENLSGDDYTLRKKVCSNHRNSSKPYSDPASKKAGELGINESTKPLRKKNRCPEQLQGNTNSDEIEAFVGDNNDERSPRCSTPDILDNFNSAASTVCRKSKPKRSSGRSGPNWNSTPSYFIKSIRPALSSEKISKVLLKRRGKSTTTVDEIIPISLEGARVD